MEGGLVEQRRESVMNKVIRKRKIKRRGKKLLPIRVGLQELYICCRFVFKGPPAASPPPPDHVQALCGILDSMKPEDLGLSRDLQLSKPGSSVYEKPRVMCTTIYESREFSLVLFFLPPGAVIPLHNHPGMTVFSKLLLGTMHVKSYDWVDCVDMKESKKPPKFRLARLKADNDYTAPCNTSVLYPRSGGNIHSLIAITPCVMLDVIGPPYSKEEGRDCSYYKEFPYDATSDGEVVKAEEGESYGWLEEIETPEESQMDGVEYLGPQIIETA
ncbi:hypothetical protein Ancab_015140 [Ancistrocladus abbreviatus]